MFQLIIFNPIGFMQVGTIEDTIMMQTLLFCFILDLVRLHELYFKAL